MAQASEVMVIQLLYSPDCPNVAAARNAFAILCRDDVEIMIRRCGPEGLLRTGGDWNVYVRMTGVNALYDRLLSRVRVVEHLHTKNYGCIEFAIEDPNGFRLVFSEKAPPS